MNCTKPFRKLLHEAALFNESASRFCVITASFKEKNKCRGVAFFSTLPQEPRIGYNSKLGNATHERKRHDLASPVRPLYQVAIVASPAAAPVQLLGVEPGVHPLTHPVMGQHFLVLTTVERENGELRRTTRDLPPYISRVTNDRSVC